MEAKKPYVNKKELARKQIFVQTSFSIFTSKLDREHFTP